MRRLSRETTSVIEAVQALPQLSVMLIGVPRGSFASATPMESQPVPALPLVGQVLLAMLLTAAGARRYRRR